MAGRPQGSPLLYPPQETSDIVGATLVVAQPSGDSPTTISPTTISPTTVSPTTVSAAELHFTIGDLWFRLGELEQAANAFQQALVHLQHVTQQPSPLVLAHINRSLADIYRIQTKYDQALSYLQAAQNALDQGIGTDAMPPVQSMWFPGRSFSISDTSASVLRVNVTERMLLLQAQALLSFLR